MSVHTEIMGGTVRTSWFDLVERGTPKNLNLTQTFYKLNTLIVEKKSFNFQQSCYCNRPLALDGGSEAAGKLTDRTLVV